MRKLLERLHARMGDLWWYSAMIFVACRSGDALQAFIGLWLVPRYVGPAELGAVLPLQQLTGLFTLPLTAVATVFAKFVNTYATRGEYGKVRAFIRDTLLASSAVFLACIAAALVVIPHFYERLNVTSGSLTLLILACGFIGNVSQLLSSAVKGLKMFRAMTLVHILGAPLRLVTLLIAMPIRALSGYILGQTTPPTLESLIAFLALRRRLKDTPPDPSWRHDLPTIVRYFIPILVLTCGGLFNTLMLTVYRQRLPAIESAAYYLLSRFTDIAAYVGLSLIVVLFPLASEAHERGQENPRVLRHALLGTALATAALALLLALAGPFILSLSTTWQRYLPYAPLFPLLTCTTGLAMLVGLVTTYETACSRFGYAFYTLVVNALGTILLIALAGAEFFRGCCPDAWLDALASLNLATLVNFSWFALLLQLLQILPLPKMLAIRR